jgi:hypothetical protein
VFNATFNNIFSVMLWRSVLLVEETGVSGDEYILVSIKNLAADGPLYQKTGQEPYELRLRSYKELCKCSRDRSDRMVVKCTTTYAISVYHH